MIEFECPSCGALGRVPESMSGKEHSCMSCGSLLEIPEIEPTETVESIGSPVGDRVDNSQNSTLELKPEPKQARSESRAPRRPRKTEDNIPCSRCGNFMSKADVYPGEKPICDDCYEKFGGIDLPFDRNSWDIGSAVGFAWERYTENNNWVTLVIANFIIAIIGMVVGFVGQILVGIVMQISPPLGGLVSLLVSLFSNVFQGVLSLGFITMVFACLTDREIELGDMFRHLGRIGSYCIYLLVGVLMFLGIGICIGVPVGIAAAATGGPEVAIIVGLCIGFPMIFGVLPLFLLAQLELAYDESCGGMQAYRNALTLLRSQWLPVIGAMIVSSLVGMLGFFACFVGLLFTIPLTVTINATVFLALRNNSGLSPVNDYD